MSKLDRDDLMEIRHILDRDATYKYLKHRKQCSFSVGDILLKKINRSFSLEPMWEYETVSDSSNSMPKRYMYVYEDPETGIGFIRQIKTNGEGLGRWITPMTNFDHDYVRFEVDPLFLDSILLGDGTFDIKSLAKAEKQKKKEIIEFNKSISHPTGKCSEINNVLSTLKVGSVFYSCGQARTGGYTGRFVREHKIVSINRKYVSALKASHKNNYVTEISTPSICDTKVVLLLEVNVDGVGLFSMNTFDLIGTELYTSKPRNILSSGER